MKSKLKQLTALVCAAAMMAALCTGLLNALCSAIVSSTSPKLDARWPP